LGCFLISDKMRYWKRTDNGTTLTVESYSHDLEVSGAIEISKEEFDAYIASLPIPEPKPTRDYGKEIDELKGKVSALEKK